MDKVKIKNSFLMNLYHWGHAHRLSLVLGLLLVLMAGGFGVTRLRMQEDIEIMLPDNDPAFVAGYQLLKAAPFTRSVVIDLEIQDPNQLSLLTETAADLSEALPGPLISEVGGAMSMDAGLAMLRWFYDHLPHYFDAETAERVAAALETNTIAATLQNNLNTLMTPEGLWLRTWLGKDPLALRNQVLRRLGGLALVPDARIEEGFLIDPTGCHALVVAETPVPLGDARRGEALLTAIDQAIATTLPPEVTAHVVCAHRYTVANAGAIKRDLVVVFAVSSLGLLLVFLFCLRHWRALYVFAVPVPAILMGILLTRMILGSISAITVGFGAVLLGISVDYGLHVFFVLRQRRENPAAHLAHLAIPMGVSCVTTVGAFAVLLASGVPIQRQLSVLAIAGLVTALALALTWLPHWIRGRGGTVQPLHLPRLPRRTVLTGWGLLLVISLPLMRGVSFDGDLKNVGLTPAEIKADEQLISKVWGDPRGRALVVTQSTENEVALRANEKTHAKLQEVWDAKALISTASVLPSQNTQAENLQRWQAFWQQGGRLDKLKQDLSQQGKALGFAVDAFQPFWERLEQNPTPFSVVELRDVTGPMLDYLFMRRDSGLGLITLVPDGNDAVSAFGPQGLDLPAETQAVSQLQFAATLRTQLEQDFRRFLVGACVMVVLVLSITLRSWRSVILCLLPALTGLLVMPALMVLMGLSFNMFNMAASVLVLGLSIDYGVFMVRRAEQQDGAEERAVFASALTTLCGFGALALAQHPAMFSLGITVVLGIVPAMLCALFVVPALLGVRQ